MKKISVYLIVCLFLLSGCSASSKYEVTQKDGEYAITGIEQVVIQGDVVNIDYVGKINNEAFANGSADGAQLQIGSKSFIDGFEEQIIGMKTGDKKTITVTFPATYGSSDLAGKEATFDIILNKIYRLIELK